MGLLDDAGIPDVISEVIGLFTDTPATIVRTPSPSFRPTSGQRVEYPPTNYSINVTPPAPIDVRLVDNHRILAEDFTVIVAAADLPDGFEFDTKTDQIILPGKRVSSIEEATGTAGGDAVFIWELRCRTPK